MRRLLVLLLLGSLIVPTFIQAQDERAGGWGRQRHESFQDRFDHVRHRNLFPSCITCHLGAASKDEEMYPAPASCVSCHDGVVEDSITWQPRGRPIPTNLRFSHDRHRDLLRAKADTNASCTDCHSEAGSEWMDVDLAVAGRCLACHGIGTGHLEAPDSACSRCHLPLAEARQLDTAIVARFPVPPSHERDTFAQLDHGRAATAGPAISDRRVASGCATCHARDFCLECHVDGPEQPAIQALEPDPRSLVHKAKLDPPQSHGDANFLYRHAMPVSEIKSDCATCHTRESCVTCHVSRPGWTGRLYAGGEGRAPGARTERDKPPSHADGFAKAHGGEARASPATCAGCHIRRDCLECHRPPVGGASRRIHAPDYLETHPAEAYSQATTCVDCHNQRSFCASCHQQSGITARGQLNSGYHDAKRFFAGGHGRAARQSLESCVSCHTERDCLACHSARGGRRFNPHGPGFKPDKLRQKNSTLCTVCHLEPT